MKAFGLLLALVGATLIVLGQRMYWTRQLARWRGCVLDGRIVSWKRIRLRHAQGMRPNRAAYQPTITFVDPSGVERTVRIGHQYTELFQKENPIGSHFPVLFDPKHPDRTLDTTWTTAYFLPALLNLCGTLITLIGLGVFFGS